MLEEVRFYHLQRQSLEAAFPKLLEKVMGRGLRCFVRVPDQDVLDRLDRALWAYDPVSFLPHGTAASPHAALQPVYLAAGDDAIADPPNDPDVLILINGGALPDAPHPYKLCLYMFDGHDDAIVQSARADWLHFKAKAENQSYWQQKEQGGWEQKA
ncbi:MULTISPECIES: DNA polymerase III subunit chi [unclassified Iodidimonas]|jgi:DNA polymerase-3 subunit chi|uniref:DNA polymerase III subunit chi n=1 Tax=unclassified Iodidimonas TaxID=2626145 RepID=UPI002482883F|nr:MULTISPECIES: DNA polymerase III subunit chi [unclassified Iodidimonas]